MVLQLSALKALTLSGNAFASLPPDFFRSLSNLEELDVSHNSLKALPESIASCTKLRVLDISANILEAFPRILGSLTSITELYAR